MYENEKSSELIKLGSHLCSGINDFKSDSHRPTVYPQQKSNSSGYKAWKYSDQW